MLLRKIHDSIFLVEETSSTPFAPLDSTRIRLASCDIGSAPLSEALAQEL